MNTSPLIIGIAGGTASGKSTLARGVKERLGEYAPELRAAVLSMDSYFKRGAEAPQLFSPSQQRHIADHNRPDTADIPRLMGDLDRICSDGTDVILVEGLMVLHDDGLRNRLQLRVYVDTPDDVRLSRRIRRSLERGDATLDGIVNYYFESAAPGHREYVEPSRKHADLIVPGNAGFDQAVQALAGYVLLLGRDFQQR